LTSGGVEADRSRSGLRSKEPPATIVARNDVNAEVAQKIDKVVIEPI
jgi:hypothetical protein